MDHPVDSLCRLCLAPSQEQYASIADSSVLFKLDVVFKFELPLDNSLPIIVCYNCCTKVDEFYSFHETVRTNQDQLNTASINTGNLHLSFEIKEEPIDEQETEETDLEETSTNAALLEQTDKADDPDSTEFDPAVDKSVPKKNVQVEIANTMPDDNWKIVQFFNGISCNVCSESFETFRNLQLHSRKVHNQSASIICCERKYFKKYNLIQHINLHQDSKLFYCELCKKNYSSKDCLSVHIMKFHTKPEELPFQCDICSKKFPRISLLNSHLKIHVQAKCSVCDRTMSNIYSLNVHMRKIHSEQQRKSAAAHVCDTCGRVYHLKQSLEKHINLQHLGAKDTDRIQCRVCGKWVKNKQYLKVHIRYMHSVDNLQVECDLCHQVWASKRALAIHKNSEHSERNLKCEICGKTFNEQKKLKEHRAAHMGQLLYTCTVCGYGSNYNGNLYTHLKKKHPTEYAEAKASGKNLFAAQKDTNSDGAGKI